VSLNRLRTDAHTRRHARSDTGGISHLTGAGLKFVGIDLVRSGSCSSSASSSVFSASLGGTLETELRLCDTRVCELANETSRAWGFGAMNEEPVAIVVGGSQQKPCVEPCVDEQAAMRE